MSFQETLKQFSKPKIQKDERTEMNCASNILITVWLSLTEWSPEKYCAEAQTPDVLYLIVEYSISAYISSVYRIIVFPFTSDNQSKI